MATKTTTTKAATKSASSKSASASSKSNTATVKAAPKKSSVKGPSHDEIARQAFMLWQQRGGSEMENWLEAERQLR